VQTLRAEKKGERAGDGESIKKSVATALKDRQRPAGWEEEITGNRLKATRKKRIRLWRMKRGLIRRVLVTRLATQNFSLCSGSMEKQVLAFCNQKVCPR